MRRKWLGFYVVTSGDSSSKKIILVPQMTSHIHVSGTVGHWADAPPGQSCHKSLIWTLIIWIKVLNIHQPFKVAKSSYLQFFLVLPVSWGHCSIAASLQATGRCGAVQQRPLQGRQVVTWWLTLLAWAEMVTTTFLSFNSWYLQETVLINNTIHVFPVLLSN